MSIALSEHQKKYYITFIDLLSSVINQKNPPALEEDFDWNFTAENARRNAVLNLIGYTLDKVNVKPPQELRDNILNRMNYDILKETSQLYDVEKILKQFDKEGIRNVPLKGYFMKRLYPQSDFRTMGDIDILVDRSSFNKVRKIFLDNKFENTGALKSKEIHFTKDLMYFEIHADLSENFEGYFDDIWDKVKLRDGYNCSYEMSPEDFYTYMIYHSGKHFAQGGIGIRMIMDIYVFLKNFPNLDFEYIKNMLGIMGFDRFEQSCREIALNWFSDEPTVINELGELVMYCSTFGNRDILFYKSKATTGRAFWLKQVFIPYNSMRKRYYYLEKAPVLLPFSWVQFWFTRIFINKDLKLKEGFSDRAVNLDEKDAAFVDEIRNKLGI